MVGTLTVQNLQGPTSGANANKVIIPSGQTIDASAGTLVPSAGAVVQVIQEYNPSASHITTTSGSLVASGITASITPKYSNSLIIVEYSCTMGISATASNMRAQMYTSVGSGARAPMSGSASFHMTYMEDVSKYIPIIFKGNYTATSTNTLTFEPYVMGSGDGQVYFTHQFSSYSLTLTEIKQ
jgi:hypothetical protein